LSRCEKRRKAAIEICICSNFIQPVLDIKAQKAGETGNKEEGLMLCFKISFRDFEDLIEYFLP
jgi:hypothetical protein